MSWPRGAALLLLVAASCTLPARRDDDDGSPSNVCASDADCGPAGVCLRGRCRPTDVDELPVVLEITRSQLSGADPGQVVHIYLSESLPQLRALDQQGGSLNLGLPPQVSVEVTMLAPGSNDAPTSARGCTFDDQAPDRTLPFHVTARPSSSRRGLQIATYARPARDPKDINPPLTLEASLVLPPDTYDLYLQPTGDAGCPIPPILRRAEPLTDAVNIRPATLSATSRLCGSITAPPGLDLSGWTARLVESSSGLLVSTVDALVSLGDGLWGLGTRLSPAPPEAALCDTHKLAPLEYYLPTRFLAADNTTLFFVLTPPADLVAPRLAWDLSVLDPTNKGTISLDLSAMALDTVEVGLRVERAQDTVGQKATVWLRSQLTPGALVQAPEGAIAAFALGPLATDDTGSLTARLLPGLYDAVAVAESADPLDAGRKSFDFRPGPDGDQRLEGFTLAVPEQPSVAVPVLASTDGAPAPRLAFELSPSKASKPSFATLFGLTDLAPRGASGLTGPDGVLRASADAGLYDLTVRFPPERGFPWLVKPGVTLPLAVDGSLRVSLPVEVRGIARDLPLGEALARPLAGATLRAYFLVGDTYIPVATATVDSSGAYRLLLPSRL